MIDVLGATFIRQITVPQTAVIGSAGWRGLLKSTLLSHEISFSQSMVAISLVPYQGTEFSEQTLSKAWTARSWHRRRSPDSGVTITAIQELRPSF